ncbi:MAG: hypothetical protein JWR24_3357 [Actinoallomurus sp.]|jgi:hypothetical protein|nr:hypothetical protein [Actinoallomurus sp.]
MPPVDPGPVPLGAYNNWPGIDAPGHVRVNRTQLRAIARRLETHLEELLSADKDLKPVGQGAFGTWDAAQQFYPSMQAGHATLVDQHSRFLHAVMDMIKKLHRSAQAYDEVEAELERRIAEVDKRLNAVSTTNLGGHDTSSAGSSVPNTTVPNSLNPEGRN